MSKIDVKKTRFFNVFFGFSDIIKKINGYSYFNRKITVA